MLGKASSFLLLKNVSMFNPPLHLYVSGFGAAACSKPATRKLRGTLREMSWDPCLAKTGNFFALKCKMRSPINDKDECRLMSLHVPDGPRVIQEMLWCKISSMNTRQLCMLKLRLEDVKD